MANIVAFSEFYKPGFAGGGTIVSLSRIINEESTHEFRVLTNDHDLGSKECYPGVTHQVWHSVGGADVGYLRFKFRDLSWAVRELRNRPADLYYVNSLQCPEFSLLPLLLRKMRVIPHAMVMVAPRGECGIAAQAHKGLKKRMAKPLIKWLIGTNAVWHASSGAEAADIIRWYGQEMPQGDRLIIRSDPPPRPSSSVSKGSGESPPVVMFASRIDHMKGLDIALDVMRRMSKPCVFRVAGSVSDNAYWQRCQELAKEFPRHVKFQYCGPYSPDTTAEIMSSADLVFLPTRGENFGHAIAEALSVGCPVVISQETIWTELVNAGAGNAGLADDNLHFLDSFIGEDFEERFRLRQNAHAAYAAWYTSQLSQDGFFAQVLE